MLSVQKSGSNIIVNNTLGEDQFVMISNMGGQILRNGFCERKSPTWKDDYSYRWIAGWSL